MRREQRLQTHLPRFEPDGVTHARDCACPRCDAGYAPSERQRRDAAARWQAQQAAQDAARLLERQRRKRVVKALALREALAEEERHVDELLQAQQEVRARIEGDARLEALLALRRSGQPPERALVAAERAPDRSQPAPLRLRLTPAC